MAKTVCVVVLGDMGHSPRMCNQALSLAEKGFNVRYIGYGGSALPRRIDRHPKIVKRPMKTVPESFASLRPKFLYYAVKVIWQTATLLWALITGRPDFILVQNPPSIPALAVCRVYASSAKAKFIIDWHNYGYSILALGLGAKHPLVKLSEKAEAYFGPKADSAFCVSKAMQKDLAERWGVDATVLYDRPAERFRNISSEEKCEFFQRLGFDDFTVASDGGKTVLRKDRPGLLVSSTSWTEDEDFGLLLDALQTYETASDSGGELPKLLCVITGKGPLKERYQGDIRARRWKRVKVLTPWLEPDDYPLMLAAADLGVCLHASSSGLDLPMKVVDMFGCGLPVAAVKYPALPELVMDGENGFVFEDSERLSEILLDWFAGFPEGTEKRYDRTSGNLASFMSLRWSEYWTRTAYPTFVEM